GMGFVLEADEAQAWIAENSRNAEVLFPYLSGEDLNQRPDASPTRWVIDFKNLPEPEAAKYRVPFERVQQLVKPERQSNKDQAVREHPWWRFWRTGPAMRKAIAGLDEVLAIARVSKSVMPVRVPSCHVFSDSLVVFATDSFADQAILSSSAHQLWAIKYGSGMRNDPRYTPSDVFETFPRPAPIDRLGAVGRILDVERRNVMLRRNLGLTKLYNFINDPAIRGDTDITRLRETHVELDREVMDAYGWSDLELDHGFHTYRQMIRWSVSPAARVEIFDRLLEEAHRRVEENKYNTRPSASGSEIPKEQGVLFT
ncbi:type IIL restriction-modification enzyme MmeI, partial [Amycolatopsis sp. NPDC047767]|uniref:type IIL restriction-modification enzyme MmeI n=1 Tax=Amycolatopsis sp. NPDC047767 TaxID=3156765 RepID=UPI00345144BD